MNRDAVIVSTARTGIGKAYRGAFNATPSPTLAAHPIRAAIERARVDPAEIDDVIMGAALQQGVQTTIGRTAALRAGLPVTVAGMSIDRQCASGLMAIATGAKQVIVDRMEIVVAGGVESISLVQTGEMRLGPDPELLSMHNGVYMPMIDTAEVVGKRYDAAGIVQAGALDSLEGAKINIGGTAAAPTVNGATVLCGNIPTKNATVFVIGQVLSLPAS